MADKTWNDFLDNVLPFANAPKTIAENAVRDACKEFLDYSFALRSDFDSFTLVNGTSEYTLTFTTDGIATASGQYEPIAVVEKSVYLGTDTSLWEITEGQLDQRVFQWHQRTATTPSHCLITWDRKFRVYPEPSANSSDSVTGECYITVTQSSVGVLDTIYNKWAEEIGYGAIARLKRIPDQVWSDLASAEYFERKFDMAKHRAKSIVNKGRTELPSTVKPYDDIFLIG